MSPLGPAQARPLHHLPSRAATLARRLAPAVALALSPFLSPAQTVVVHAASGDCTSSGTATSCAFSYTGAAQTWTVPTGVTQATFGVFGAQGGQGSRLCNTNCGFGGPGGLGGEATATLTVTSGTVFQLNVGGAGADGTTTSNGAGGGFNGGGAGGAGTPPGDESLPLATSSGGGGGGGSDVRTATAGLADRLVVAGGGGGGGGSIGGGGGGGGYFGGGGGAATTIGGDTVENGGGGTQTAGGTAGDGGNGICGLTGGTRGNSGTGGKGGTTICNGARNDGGGGGAGGGTSGAQGVSASASGGGGGSGFGPAGVAFNTGVQTGNGKIVVTYTVDTTAPTTTIDTQPTNPTNASSASFTFHASDPDDTTGFAFACSLDGAAFAACTSPATYSNLAGGSHTFKVHASDAAGNQGTDAGFIWRVDSTAPTTTIDSQPANPTNATTASVTFHATDPDDTTGFAFACSLDGAAFAACTSPATYSNLANGSHTFKVHASDVVGNQGTDAGFTWRVDTTHFSGFQQPVDNLPTVNKGKAGRTYPLKWQLTDDSGAYISSLSAVTSVSVKTTSCSTFTDDPADALETEATGGTGLRYDTTSNQYVYNWATPSKGCYTLFLTLSSGAVFPAYFNLL